MAGRWGFSDRSPDHTPRHASLQWLPQRRKASAPAASRRAFAGSELWRTAGGAAALTKHAGWGTGPTGRVLGAGERPEHAEPARFDAILLERPVAAALLRASVWAGIH
jgi:hypothetical protein